MLSVATATGLAKDCACERCADRDVTAADLSMELKIFINLFRASFLKHSYKILAIDNETSKV